MRGERRDREEAELIKRSRKGAKGLREVGGREGGQRWQDKRERKDETGGQVDAALKTAGKDPVHGIIRSRMSPL